MKQISKNTELAGWINENRPEKITWIQKIRDYDYQKYMIDYWKDSRDMWRSIAISKSIELERMTKIADAWKEKATFGRRLKFSVGHNHIEIIIGNPICVAINFNEVDGNYDSSHSICNPKDQYDWKKGAIQAFTNLINDYQIDRSEWFNKLFKKYPELKERK